MTMLLPVAIDAMGGDHAPSQILEGARQAAELGIPIVLVGRSADLGDTFGLPVIEASQVIAMDDDPAKGVRTMKDSSLVRAAEAVRDGKASAFLSAGNTGATMASALLRMGRIKGVIRPAIATPDPRAGFDPDRSTRRRCQRRVHRRIPRAVRADGLGVRQGPLRHRKPAGRPALDRRGGTARATRWPKKPTKRSGLVRPGRA